MPIPLGLAIAAGAGQVGGGIYNIAAGAKQRREGERLFEQQLEDLRSGKYDLSVSQAERDVADLARQYGEQAAMTAGRRGEAAQQAALFGLRGGDPRLAAMMPAQTRAMGEATQQAELAGLGTSLAAQQRLAGTEQAILTQNEQARRMLEQMQMQRGAAAGEAGRQMQTAGISQLASAPMDLAALNIAGGGFEKTGAGAQARQNLRLSAPARKIARQSEDVGDLLGSLSQYGLGQTTPAAPSQVNYSSSYGDVGNLLQTLGQDIPRSTYVPPSAVDLYQQIGGGFPQFEGGGEMPQVTPGEFNHDTNPIDMVAEDGTKVGEVTGGELIFNPDQSETIEELVEKGDGEALIMYLKQLLEQPQFEEQD